MVVKHLVLNFVSPADRNLLAGPDERMLWRHARKLGGAALTPAITRAALAAERAAVAYQTKLVRPEWLARYLAGYLRLMIDSTPARVMRHGGLLYERVGAIHMQVDGETIDEIDLGAMIEGLRCQYSARLPNYEEVKARFDEWHGSTLAKRRASGLWVGKR
ncbi:hypothetical protein PG984_011826 [Apiospora sp. TS-2023a]